MVQAKSALMRSRLRSRVASCPDFFDGEAPSLPLPGTKPMHRVVSFNSLCDATVEVTPYGEKYGCHPNFFNYDSQGSMALTPAGMAAGVEVCKTSGEIIAATAHRLTVGDKVLVKSTKMSGVIITDDASNIPYEVRYYDDTKHVGWLHEKDVEEESDCVVMQTPLDDEEDDCKEFFQISSSLSSLRSPSALLSPLPFSPPTRRPEMPEQDKCAVVDIPETSGARVDTCPMIPADTCGYFLPFLRHVTEEPVGWSHDHEEQVDSRFRGASECPAVAEETVGWSQESQRDDVLLCTGVNATMRSRLTVGSEVRVKATKSPGIIITDDSSDIPYQVRYDDGTEHVGWLHEKDVESIGVIVSKGGRLTVGSKVRVKATKLSGIIMTDDSSNIPYRVRYDDGTEHVGWLHEKDVEDVLS